MGDYLEGKHKLNKCTAKIYNSQTKELEYEVKNTDIVISIDNFEKIPVFCMAGIATNDLSFERENEVTFSTNAKLIEILNGVSNESYWNSALIITNISEFINRIKESCKNQGLELQNRFVNYTDMNKNYTDRNENVIENIANIAFWKDNSYSYQHEYRFAFTNKLVDDNFILDIGDIYDISRIYDEKELIRFMNENLKIELKKERKLI